MSADHLHRNPARQKGSILIVCFFVLVTLSMFTITVGYSMRQKFQVLSRLDARQKLRFVGEAGVQKAIYELLQWKERASVYDALNQNWSQNESEFREIEVEDGFFSIFYDSQVSERKVSPQKDSHKYGLIDEERKINLNFIKSPEVLQRLFQETAGVDADTAKGLADSIRDWKDEDDDLSSSSGAESRYYKSLTPAYIPRNGEFETLSELRWIKGMDSKIYEKVCPYLTLDSSGQINLNTASKAVLVALGFSPYLCDKIISYRNGRDQLEGTGDDQIFEDLPSVAQSLANTGYLNNNERENLQRMVQSGMLTVKSSYFTARVLAKLKHKTQSLGIVAVFDEKGVVKRWEEVFGVS